MSLARFSFVGFVLTQTFLLCLVAMFWWMALGGGHDRHGAPTSQDPVIWFFCLISPFFLWLAFAQARQFLFHGRRAVWMEGGAIFYFTQLSFRPVRKVALDRIDAFAAGRYIYLPLFSPNSIRIVTRDARHNSEFLTWLLSEPRDVVLARLNQALAESRG